MSERQEPIFLPPINNSPVFLARWDDGHNWSPSPYKKRIRRQRPGTSRLIIETGFRGWAVCLRWWPSWLPPKYQDPPQFKNPPRQYVVGE